MPMQTLSDLLDVVERLPATERTAVIAQLDEILELAEGPRELAIGLLALDLAPYAQTIDLRDPADHQLTTV